MFQQGLSGLNGASQQLDVIGNNIANASTVGFKGSQAQFADLYANSLNGVSGTNAGIGVSVSQIAQQFTQGNITTSDNPLDVAINGSGFFRTTVNGAIQYSRNGQFQLNQDGALVNAQGAQVTGYLSNKAGVILQGAPVPITIDSSDLQPVQTTTANLSLNLDSNSTVPTTIPFNANDPTSYNKQTVLDVYDSLGNAHTMSTYYVKTGADTWDVYAGVDGTEVTAQNIAAEALQDPAVIAARAVYQADLQSGQPQSTLDLDADAYGQAMGGAMMNGVDANGVSYGLASVPGVTQAQLDALNNAFGQGPQGAATDVGAVTGATPDSINTQLAAALSAPATKVGTLVFDKNGALSSAGMAALTPPQTVPFTISLPIFPDVGSTEPLSVVTGFTGTTQYGSSTSDKSSTQNGYSSGSLERFAVGTDGVILGQYSNGQSRPLAQVVLANFANDNGLTPLGANAWAQSSTSGTPQIGTPGDGSLGQLQANATESSNVDLTAELVNMITAQRVYQANAQTIKTEDQVLQTLVNLR